MLAISGWESIPRFEFFICIQATVAQLVEWQTLEQEFKDFIPVSTKYFSFSMIFHLNEKMNHKANNKNQDNSSIPWSLANDRRQK